MVEVFPVSIHIGNLGEFCLCDFVPCFHNFRLHVLTQLPVIHTDKSFRILLCMCTCEFLAEQTIHLLDAALMQVFRFHDFIKNHEVQRNHRNRGACLCDYCLIHRYIRADTSILILFIDPVGTFFQILLRHTDRTFFVNRVGQFRPYVRICHGHRMFTENIRIVQRVDPVGPVLAAHNLYRRCNLFLIRRLQRHGGKAVVFRVPGKVGKRFSHRFQDRSVGCAVRRGSARCRKAVDDHIHLAQIFADLLDGLLFTFYRKCVSIDRLGIQTLLLCKLLKRCCIIITWSRRSGCRRILLKHNAKGIGSASECQRNP